MTESWKNRFSRDEFKGTTNNASFKDVPFIMSRSEGDFGRRTADHEFPQKDVPYTEDLGKKIRRYTIEGRVLGGDYLTQRDNLLRVCEEEGVGVLIHPYYGSLNVICKGFRPRDTKAELRTCTFQLVFVEEGEFTFPISVPDTEAIVETTVNDSILSLKSVYADVYGAVIKPLVFLESKSDNLNLAFDAIDDVKKIVTMPATVAADYRKAFVKYTAEADLLVLSGSDMADALVELITFGIYPTDEELDGRDAFNKLNNLFSFSPSVTASSDDTEAMNNLVQQSAMVTMALIVSRIPFESSDEASFFRDIVLSKLDSVMLLTLDDDVLQKFRDIRKSIVDDVESKSLTLSQLSTFILNQVTPGLVVSNFLYGGVEQEQDIIDRNRIEHPGFVPGGVDLEVLLNV